MARLILQPSYDDVSRAQIETHLEVVRARRLVAALEYQEGVNIKLEHEVEANQRRLTSKYAALGRTIEQMDRALERAEKLMSELELLHQELGLSAAMLAANTIEDGEE